MSKGSKRKKSNTAGAASAAAADARAKSSQVEKAFVGSGSVNTYMGQLVRLVEYIFDHHKEHLVEEHLIKMEQAAAQDAQQKTKLRIKLRQYICDAATAIQAKRDDRPHNCFIKIEDEADALKYDTVVKYMDTKFNVEVVDRGAAEAYLKDVRDGICEITPDMEVGDKVRVKVFQSESQYSGIRCALAYVYTSARVTMPFASELGIYIKGVGRYIAAAKQHLGLKLTEGKDSMNQEVMELIAENLFRSKDKRDILYHLIFLLDWNLMKRAENCLHAKMIHMGFVEDHLTFTFAKEKGKQHGDMHGPWHCFANPKKPHICLVLSFARYFLTYPQVLREGAPLFEGTNQYGRYSSRLHQLFHELKDDLKNLGVDYKDLGTHSARKGVGTMVANASTVGPPIVALCLRAGWKLGGVKEKYLFRADGGDMAVGRRAACLDVDDKEFAISPPYFDYSHLDADGTIETKENLERWLKQRLPDADNIPANSWNLVLQCFASVCYHYEYLCEHLDDKCSFRNTAVFRDLPKEIQDLATVKFPWDKTSWTPKLNGVPPHVLHIAKIESLERKLDTLEENLTATIVGEMERRGFSSTAFKTSDITDALSAVTQQLTNQITTELKEIKDAVKSSRGAADDYVIVDGADVVLPGGGVAIVDEDDWFNDANGAEGEEGGAEGEEGEEGTQPNESEQRRLQRKRKEHETAVALVKKRKFTVGHHHGMLNVLPPNFTLTSMTPLQLVYCWLMGSVRHNIPALGLLDSKHVLFLKGGNKMRHKMSSVMRIVEKMAREKNAWYDKKSDWDYDKVTKMWDAISTEFKAKYCQTKRKTQINYHTVYRNMTDANAFNNPRNKKEKAKRLAMQQQQQAAMV